MEGYLIRVPVEACFPDNRPAWRQRADPNGPVRSRVLYYVLEEGFLRGYESPDDVGEPVECFQLTSHRLEVNIMNSLNIIELKARAVTEPPVKHFVEQTSSSDSSDSDDDNDNDSTNSKQSEEYTPHVAISPTPAGVVSGSFHVVFFASNKEMTKKWSAKLLNWNRFVFGAFDNLDAETLKQAKDEIVCALAAINAANRFLRPVEVQTSPLSGLPSRPTHQDVNLIPAPIAQTIVSVVQESSPVPADKDINTEPSSATKPSDPQPWWMVPFARSRKISSYSLSR